MVNESDVTEENKAMRFVRDVDKLWFSANEGHVRARQRWISAKVLIVDEISMVSATMFELLELCARRIRGSSDRFGGIQLVCCGDFLQLGPIRVRRLLNAGL
jgi:ATP-dependent exoDNAse (exonuclease V) alpha subunit